MRDYLAVGRALSAKVRLSLLELCDLAVDSVRWDRLAYFQLLLDKHLDLGQRRLLNEETIPAHEKMVSLFEPHPEWIQKGKQRPNVELGHRLLLATDQNQWIQDYVVLLTSCCSRKPKWIKALRWWIGCWAGTARPAWGA